MKTIGIVAEWNPFHNGHQYLIDTIRAEAPEACIVSIMSGPFCQRGEVASFDKWQRAEMALAGGVDVVLELPQLYATASLEAFAQGGVAGLMAFHPFDVLYCGSECGDIDSLTAQADYLSSHKENYDAFVHQATNEGTSYAEASQAFLREAGFDVDKATPNDRLALHYRLALPRTIPMKLIPRSTAHHSTAAQGQYLSASAIRQHFPNDFDAIADFLPATSRSIIAQSLAENWQPANSQALLTSLKVLACHWEADTLAQVLTIRDGWTHRLLDAIHKAKDFNTLLTLAQTRHYSRSRIRRLILTLLSPLPQAQEAPAYCRVLGFSGRGQALLRTRHSACPVIMNTAKDARFLSANAKALLQGDINRQNLADFLSGKPVKNRDYLERPRIFKA